MSTQLQKRVLVVDDDASTCELLSVVLEQRGLQVDVASDGQQALDLLRETSYAVVLLDLIMPVLDGFAVLDRMDKEGRSLPVVLVQKTLVNLPPSMSPAHCLTASRSVSISNGLLTTPQMPYDLALSISSAFSSAVTTRTLPSMSGFVAFR